MIHKDFYKRGRYVAHNRDVRYSPPHSDYTETLPRCQATASQGTSVASSGDSSYLLDDNQTHDLDLLNLARYSYRITRIFCG